MSNAVGAHGTLIATEAFPVVPATFIDIAELTSDIDFGFTRPYADTTPHNDTIDSGVPGVMRRDPINVAGNFIFNGASHDHLTGVQKHWVEGDKFGILFKGPEWASGVDEIIASGHIIAFKRVAPVSEGPFGFEAIFMLSGVMSIDGVDVGVVG